MKLLNLGCPTAFGNICALDAQRVVSGLIRLLFIGALLIAFIWLVLGGIKWIVSGGDKANVTAAREQVTQAIIGLAVVFISFVLIGVVAQLFGIDLLAGVEIKPL